MATQANWYRDHIRSFVVPALLNSKSNSFDGGWTVKNPDYSNHTSIEDKEYVPDLEAEAIVKLEIESYPTLLIDRDYRLMLDTLNALENRAKGKAIILPGRDVWPFFVLMQKRKAFRDRIYHFPWMSRNAIANRINVRYAMEKAEISKEYLLNNCYLFDTGFAGSIFTGIAKAYDLSPEEMATLLSHSGMVSSNSYSGQMCVLQKNEYRTQVLNIEENIPKYFHSGDRNGEMALKNRFEIMRTARYTYDLWHGISKKEKKLKAAKPAKLVYRWCQHCKTYHQEWRNAI